MTRSKGIFLGVFGLAMAVAVTHDAIAQLKKEPEAKDEVYYITQSGHSEIFKSHGKSRPEALMRYCAAGVVVWSEKEWESNKLMVDKANEFLKRQEAKQKK